MTDSYSTERRLRRPLTWWKWLLALAALNAIVIAALWISLDKTVPSAWAKARGWKARPIARATLEPQGIARVLSGAWRELPFSLTASEEADARCCVLLAKEVNHTLNGVSYFVGDAVRAELEEVLTRQPDYFYAEWLLGRWYATNGDAAKSTEFFERAYRHAPAIIVQPYLLADGRPMADTEVQCFALECNRVQHGSLDPSLELYYPLLRTDAEGCIYLPVYRTVYRRDDMASPTGYSASFPTLGWFEARGKVSVLPAATVTPRAK